MHWSCTNKPFKYHLAALHYNMKYLFASWSHFFWLSFSIWLVVCVWQPHPASSWSNWIGDILQEAGVLDYIFVHIDDKSEMI